MKTYAPPQITLRGAILREAIRVRELLHVTAKGDPELWCELLELVYCKDDGFFVRSPSACHLYRNKVYLRKDLNRDQEIEAIAHEYCHLKFHPRCVQYRDTNLFDAGRNEGQAIAFAETVVRLL